jgi:hypothetical protein
LGVTAGVDQGRAKGRDEVRDKGPAEGDGKTGQISFEPDRCGPRQLRSVEFSPHSGIENAPRLP